MSPRISFQDARACSMANKAARPKGRAAGGGGECWPALNPKFRFGRDARIFALGSCFATNIEIYLSAAGFDLRSRPQSQSETIPVGTLNKYSPPTIRQEIEWARRILDRDDTMRPEDAEALFCPLDEDRVVDTQLHVFDPLPRAEAVARRAVVYRIFREIFTAEVVVMTLGLVETWWDEELKLYLQDSPTRAMAAMEGRFWFERLDFATCLAETRAALALLRRGDRGPDVLLTTSPVVMSRTFTADDVIVANTYSKSVLRAVCGEIVAADPKVDYFPSYESVTRSPGEEAWEDDLVHVRPTFVARVMARVRQAFVEEEATLDAGADDLTGQMISAMDAREDAAALEAYAAIPDPMAGPPLYHLHAAILLVRNGRADDAARHLAPERLRGEAGKAHHVAGILVHLLAKAGREDLSALIRPFYEARGRLSANARRFIAEYMLRDGDTEAALAMLSDIEPAEIATDGLRLVYLRHLEALGGTAVAIRLLEDAARRDPGAWTWPARLSELLAATGERDRAIETGQQAAELSGLARATVRRQVKLLREAGRLREALLLLKAMIARHGIEPADRDFRTRLVAQLTRHRDTRKVAVNG